MLAVAILAAGKGSRMKSDQPKVLHSLAGRTLIERVCSSCKGLNPEKTIVIVGHQADLVKKHLRCSSDLEFEFVEQKEQRGTGHAVQQLIPLLKGFRGDLLVLNGDLPLLRQETIQNLIHDHKSNKAGVTFLSSRQINPKGYGRVFADKERQVKTIIEDRDCNHEQSKNNLTNSGIYCFNWSELATVLPKLNNKNNQQEFYLTDTVEMISIAMHLEVDDPDEVRGINDRDQLSFCETLIQQRLKQFWMQNGVTFVDPASCTISETCHFGKDVVIEPQTHMRGLSKVGNNCKIGPGTYIENAEIGDNVNILYSVISNAKVGSHVEIGPFSHLRPNTNISNYCRLGNFVEVKNSQIKEGSKVNHLSYIGDSQLGEGVNIGAGTITANYDGFKKNLTVIGDKTKTGANSVLVAPITIGSGVTVGAGSVLTKDVPNNSLALGRAKQLIKRNWSFTQRNR